MRSCDKQSRAGLGYALPQTWLTAIAANREFHGVESEPPVRD